MSRGRYIGCYEFNWEGRHDGSNWIVSYARRHAGKEADAEAFLKSAQPLALNEKATLKCYAIKIEPGKFGKFDTFANEAGRNAHLTGEIAKALTARANELFATPPRVEKVEILAHTPLKG